MFRYKRTILRKYNMPGLKPIASDKLLLTRFHSLQQVPLLLSFMYKRYNLYRFLKLRLKYDSNTPYVIN
jgi:hypothetical protein